MADTPYVINAHFTDVSTSPTWGGSSNYGSITITGTFYIDASNVVTSISNAKIQYGVNPATVLQLSTGGNPADQNLMPGSSPHVTTGGLVLYDLNNNRYISWIFDTGAEMLENYGGGTDGFVAAQYASLSSTVAVPAITSLSSSSGPVAGGGSVTITGNYFTGASAVKFGANNATPFTVNSDTQITTTAPAGAAGTVDVTVTTGGGTSSTGAADHYTYVAPPTVTSLSANSGSTSGGTSVVITGSNFTGTTAVKFGANNASSFTVNSSTQITATAPAGSAGTVDVTVVTPGGTSTTSASDQFTYVASPAITSLSASSGPTGGGTSVVITGANFTGATAVKFGATSAASFTVNSATQITATAPAGSAGTVDITITTPSGTSSTVAADQFTYVAAPTVSSLGTTAGPTAGGTSVVITGTNLTGATTVKFGATTASFTVNSATQITATAPAGSVGTVDVTVVTVGGTSATSAADQYTYVAAPTVTGLSVTSGSTAGSTTVVITGANLTGATAVKFGTNNASSFTVNSATQITATAPAGSAGTVDVTVITAGGTSATSASDQYTYVPSPAVTSLSVSSGPIAGGTSVVITGSNFTGATAVKFGATSAASFTVNSATQITATAPAGSAGTVDITITTPSGTSSTVATDQFTYVGLPTVSSLATTAGPTAGGTSVVISGTNFTAATAVKFGTNNAASYTVNSATQITATTPAGSAGTVDVTVSTAGGTSATSAADQFTYVAAPTVTALSVTSGGTSGGTTVVITGTNLTGATAVKFGTNNASSFTVNSATQITATAPAGSAGTVDVTVITAGGTSATSASDQYTYVPSPAVTSLSVSSGPLAGGTTVVITGANFTGATAVKFGANNAASFAVNSATQITASAPAGTGTVDITVTTASGTSNTVVADQFTYVGLPTVSSLATTAGPTAGGTSVVISGSNFTAATAVKFGANNASSYTVNSATQITATTPAGSAGTVDVTVSTAGGTSATSAADQFTYVAAPTVTALSVTSGGTTGGTTVVITGTNLTGATAVKFGATNAASLTVNSATQITATSPAGSAGTVDVTVITAGGTSATSAADQYTYVPIGVVSFTQAGPLQLTMGGALTNAASSTLSGGSYGSISYSSSNTAVATVSASGVITTVATGSVTITATQAAVNGVNLQASATYTLNVVALPVPVLSFTQSGPLSVNLGATLTNAVSSTLTGGSYGAISYSSSNTAVATVSASGVITPVTAGSVTITATQAAVTGINAQASTSYSLTVNPLPVPVLTFTQSGPQTVLLVGTLTNAASSSLNGGSYGAITYSSSNNAVATVNASGVVTPVAVGSATITATQAAVSGVNAQASASYAVNVITVPVPILNFTLVGAQQVTAGTTLSNPVTSSLSGSSYGQISYSSSNTAIATVSQSGIVSGVSAGSVTITATQAALQGANSAATASYSLTVNAVPVPVLSFTNTGNQSLLIGASLNNPAISTLTGGSYGALSYTSSNPALASVSANGVVTALGAGTVTITVTQAAVAGKNAQASISYTLTIGKNSQAALSLTADKTSITKNAGRAVLSTSGGSGTGAVSFVVSSGDCSISGNTLSAGNNPGTCVVTATKAADASYTAASATLSIQVLNMVTPTISLNVSANQLMLGQKISLTANVTPTTATGNVDFYDGSTKIGSVALSNGTAVLLYSIMTTGSHSFSVSYAGDSNVVSANTNGYSVAVVQRPDPTTSGTEQARIGAQVSSSQRFNLAQISNINNHFQQLHANFGVNNSFGIGLTLPYLDTVRMVGNKILDNLALNDAGSSNGNDFGTSRSALARQNKAPYSQGEAVHGDQLSGAGANDDTRGKQNNSRSPYTLGGMPVGFWSTGNIDVGGVDSSSGGNRNKFTTGGISLGMDMLVREDFIVGGAIGYGRDTTTLDTLGSESRSRQWSGSLYGSYKLDKEWYIDGMLGYGSLQIDNNRWDSTSAALLSGNRGGRSYYSSLSLTRAMEKDGLKIHPFGRLDVIHAKLDAYAENADSMALSYNAASYTSTAFVGGLDVTKEYQVESGKLMPSFKLQLRHSLSGSMTQSLYYSELGAAGGLYSIAVQGLPDNVATLGLGLGFATRSGFRTNVTWLGSMGGSAYRSNGLRFDVQLGF